MPKHTPGIWGWWTSNSWRRLRAHQNGHTSPVLMPTIHAIDNHPDIEVSEADANLIAAAPELLAACQEFVRKVECGEASSRRSYKQMKAAIAKAEGES